MKLNWEKWNVERVKVETRIGELKDLLTTSGHMGTWQEWKELSDLSYWATSLYMLRAELRGEGRLHAKVEVRYVNNPNSWGFAMKAIVPVTRADQQKRVFAGWHHEYLKPVEITVLPPIVTNT